MSSRVRLEFGLAGCHALILIDIASAQLITHPLDVIASLLAYIYLVFDHSFWNAICSTFVSLLWIYALEYQNTLEPDV